MRAYNVEIYDRNLNIKDHFTIGGFACREDYLSLPENAVTADGEVDASGGDYIRIMGGGLDYFGIVQEPVVGKNESSIRFKSFLSVFSNSIMFDTNLQGSGTALEDVIAQLITDGWIRNTDAAQNIPGLSVSTISSTTSWGFHLTSDVEGLAKTIINFQTVILARALTKYSVGVYVTPDFDAKTIALRVGILDAQPVTVETNLPSVVEKTVIVDQASFAANKAIIYDRADMVTNEIYYLHPDGTVNQSDTDRILPVVYKMTAIDAEQFSTAAAAEAANILAGAEKNLAELQVLNTDPLAKLEIGRPARILTGSKTISSVLTGKTIGETTLLIFGAIRLELTTILREKGV